MDLSETDKTPAIVIGLSPTGLYAVRELGRAGVPVHGVSRYAQCGNASRFLTSSFVAPTTSALRDHLLRDLKVGNHRPVLIAASDDDVEFICANSEELAQKFVFQPSYADGLASEIMTKASFYELCVQHGAQLSKTLTVPRDALAETRDDIAYPCFVKPSLVHEIKSRMKGAKGWTARNAPDLMKLAQELPAGQYDLIVQEIIPGPESNITLYCAYFDGSGQAHQAFTARKVRQFPPGFGSASLVVSEELEETQALSEQLLKSIGYRGIAATEFKRDPRDNRLKIIEINPRPSLWFSASTAAGRHVTLAAYHDLAATGEKVSAVQQKNGVCWRYGAKDLYSKWFYRLNRNFILPPPDTRAADTCSARIDAVASDDDPRPLWAERRNWSNKIKTRLFGTPSRATDAGS